MIYSNLDLLLLEKKTDAQLERDIEDATAQYENVQAYYSNMEEEAKNVCAFESCQPRLDIIFNNLKNIEGFIRKALNLLHNYDDGKYIQQSRKNRDRFTAVVVIKKKATKKIRIIGM